MRLAEELLGARRRLPHLRSPGDRPGRQHRRHPGVLQLDRRHHRAEHDDHPEPGNAGRLRRRRIQILRRRRAGSGVASFQCRLDSSEAAAWATCASPKSYSALADGSHTFEVRAIDQAGNADATPASFSWTVDTTAANTTITQNPAALVASGAAEFKFCGDDAGGSGVASFQCRLDSSEAAAWATCASPKSYSALADGSHTFEVRAIDQAGNADATPASFSWTVDTTAPNTTIDPNPPALVATGAAEFTF